MSMLYVVATPIGNMGDITVRAKELITSAGLILCEDTRVAEKLLTLLMHDAESERGKPQLISYHKFNEQESIQTVIDRIHGLKDHAVLISDAGTPTISDPGQILVQACHYHNIPVSIAPGPCAFISAVALSGFSFDKLQFIGFLPKQMSERKSALYEALQYDGVTALYESPLRIFDTLLLIEELDKHRMVAVVRELTKKFEEVCVGTIGEALAGFKERNDTSSIKGEFVLILDKPQKNLMDTRSEKERIDELVNEVIQLREKQSISLSEACSLVAKAHGIKKGTLYNHCLKNLL